MMNSGGRFSQSHPLFSDVGVASFSEFLTQAKAVSPVGPDPKFKMTDSVPHGTTIVALEFNGGVLLAGDRRATMNNLIAHRELQKVFKADEYSAIGISGSAGVGVGLVKLFQVELEHYEKIEGSALSIQGKANRLSSMVQSNLALAVQGLAVLPVFVGLDLLTGKSQIYSFDISGGTYREQGYYAIGSGAHYAHGALKRSWSETQTEAEAIEVAISAIWDAADEDSATAGPDFERKIWPFVVVVDPQGYREIPKLQLEATLLRILASRGAARSAGQLPNLEVQS